MESGRYELLILPATDIIARAFPFVYTEYRRFRRRTSMLSFDKPRPRDYTALVHEFSLVQERRENDRLSLRTRISNLSNRPIAPLIIILLGLVTSLAFCFLVFPRISGPIHLLLDADNHGSLGYGIWKNHSLSYYPDTQPTVARGPVYPAFIALTLALSNGWWPYSTQIGQCIVFSLTCLLAFHAARMLWNRPIGFIVGVVCAIHPLVIWYTSRIWVETLAIFFFTAMTASVLYLSLRPTAWRAVLLGVVIGTATLCKATFLPFIIIIPLLLSILKPKKLRSAYVLLVFVVGAGVVTPWSIRNYALTGKIIPVAAMTGYNFYVGDIWIEEYSKSPFSMSDLWIRSIDDVKALYKEAPPGLTRSQRDAWRDTVCLHRSLAHYRRDPGFFLKKLGINAWLYWSLGETPKKTLLLAIQQLTLLFLCILSALRFRGRDSLRCARCWQRPW